MWAFVQVIGQGMLFLVLVFFFSLVDALWMYPAGLAVFSFLLAFALSMLSYSKFEVGDFLFLSFQLFVKLLASAVFGVLCVVGFWKEFLAP